MLELTDITLTIGNNGSEQNLLSEISLRLPRAHFAAIIGPSGCGKSTLLKTIAGIREHSIGRICWDNRDLEAEGDMDPHEIGYVPQFSIAHELLSVEESVRDSLRLRVAQLSRDSLDERVESILKDVGLIEISSRRVALLSGGQKRRLALAIEMVSSPPLLLSDEVTSGLDPKSEDEIVNLMHGLSRSSDRIVLSVTHSLRHLSLYDSVIVLYQGVLAFHGNPQLITHYFNIERPEELYPRLAERKAEEWQRSWQKHRDAYYQQSSLPTFNRDLGRSNSDTGEIASDTADKISPEDAEIERLRAIVEGKHSDGKSANDSPNEPAINNSRDARTPSVFAQFSVVFARQWKLFFRDRGQVILQAALLLGFPCLVAIFAYDGLPQVTGLADAGSSIGSAYERMKLDADSLRSISKVGSLVSGLIMFQVILLALMGSNNSAREIAAERHLLEKEKFAGLSPFAYVASKVAFLALLVFAQSAWMATFVNMIVGFQGSFASQLLNLVLINASITAVSLGISAWTKTAEQASLLSIYLVGFQLPLSGAVLALPKALAAITQVFIASYWSWSGFIRSMESTRYYDAMTTTGVIPTDPAAGSLCMVVLTAHTVFGCALAYAGTRNSRWE